MFNTTRTTTNEPGTAWGQGEAEERARRFSTRGRTPLPIAAFVGLALGLAALVGCTSTDSNNATPSNAATTTVPEPITSASFKDASFIIEGRTVALVNGVSEVEAAPGSASKIVTRYFGNEASGDLNGDGVPDMTFLLTQSTGGSGTFYYVVAALATKTGYTGTNAVLLGDRVAPQTTESRNGDITVNYAVRAQGEPMTTAPSVGVSKRLRVVDGKLIER